MKKLKMKVSDEEYQTLDIDQKIAYHGRRAAHFHRLVQVTQVIQLLVMVVFVGVMVVILTK